MSTWLIVIPVAVVLFAVLVLFLVLRSREAVPPAVPSLEPGEDESVREARHRVLEERGTELIERRVELDQKRGPLFGNTDVDREFTELEERLRAGEISEEEFEQEKIRLLGG